MHNLAERIILKGLIELGILTGDFDLLEKNRVVYNFMPHGLGHFIGLDVHDVSSKATTASGLIEAGNCITIEPGCYFRKFHVTGELKKYVNMEKI